MHRRFAGAEQGGFPSADSEDAAAPAAADAAAEAPVAAEAELGTLGLDTDGKPKKAAAGLWAAGAKLGGPGPPGAVPRPWRLPP